MEKIITYFGQKAKVGCDEKCNKAWGRNRRPRVYPTINETKIFGLEGGRVYPDDYNEEDYVYCSDDELDKAPVDPGTYEGSDGKPVGKKNIPNKWCVRECERCSMSNLGEIDKLLTLRDFSKRV